MKWLKKIINRLRPHLSQKTQIWQIENKTNVTKYDVRCDRYLNGVHTEYKGTYADAPDWAKQMVDESERKLKEMIKEFQEEEFHG